MKQQQIIEQQINESTKQQRIIEQLQNENMKQKQILELSLQRKSQAQHKKKFPMLKINNKIEKKDCQLPLTTSRGM